MDEQLQLELMLRDELDPQCMVEEFHWATNSAVDQRTADVIGLRRRLITEEHSELRDELVAAHQAVYRGKPIDNLDQIAKEAADLLYVVYGMAVALGIDLMEAFRRVHASNMSKLVDGKPVLRDDGKVLKGPNYFEPDMSGTYREEDSEEAQQG